MKRFMAWLLVLMLMIPAAALADIPVIPMDDTTDSPIVVYTPTPDADRPLPTYNPYQTDYVWPTATPAPVTRTLSEGMKSL